MTRKWPRFITKDLGDGEADAVEMQPDGKSMIVK